MKRAYAAPTLLVSGEVTQETCQSDSVAQPEPVNPLVYRNRLAGSVGFGL